MKSNMSLLIPVGGCVVVLKFSNSRADAGDAAGFVVPIANMMGTLEVDCAVSLC